jgi:hypothetical protein
MEIYYTVWQYRATNYETHSKYLRTIFFYAGSINYNGSWMGPSDCVWMVPRPNTWE